MIGDLRHRLTIEEPVASADGGGGTAVDWIVYGDVWGRVEMLSGDEEVRFGAVRFRTRVLVTLRYRTDISTAMRFRHGARVYGIRAVLDQDGTRRRLACLCDETGGEP